MKIQKEYLELLERMSEMSQNALDSFARISEAATLKSENLLRQQMEMFQLTAAPNMNPLAGAAEITEIVFKNRERLARQQLDMLKLTIESSSGFLTDNGDNSTIEETLKAQRQFAESLSDKIFDNVKNNLEICFDTQSEINQVVKRNLSSGSTDDTSPPAHRPHRKSRHRPATKATTSQPKSKNPSPTTD